MLKLSCARRRSCQSAFGQGFDSPQLHQNTQVRTLLVQKRVRPDKKTAAEVIVLCGSFLIRRCSSHTARCSQVAVVFLFRLNVRQYVPDFKGTYRTVPVIAPKRAEDAVLAPVLLLAVVHYGFRSFDDLLIAYHTARLLYFASGIRSRNAAAVSKSQPSATKAL